MLHYHPILKTVVTCSALITKHMGDFTIIRGCLRKVFLAGAFCVCVLAWQIKYIFTPLLQILFKTDFSNCQDILSCIVGSLRVILVAVS